MFNEYCSSFICSISYTRVLEEAGATPEEIGQATIRGKIQRLLRQTSKYFGAGTKTYGIHIYNLYICVH